MKAILHIGVHKTGTTAIQRTLHRHAELLMSHGFMYRTSRPELFNHHLIADSLRKGSESNDWAISAVRSLVKEATEAGCHTCIVSSEMFSASQTDIALIRDAFVGCELQVVAYVRRPDEIVASAHNQMVRDEGLRWTRHLNEPPFSYDPSYRSILSRWVAAFTPAEMMLAPFAPLQWHGADLVTDFLYMVGLRDSIKLVHDFTDAEMNVGLPESMIEILRLANATMPMNRDAHSAFVGGLYGLLRQYPELFPHGEPMTRRQRRNCFRRLARKLPHYRPYFRPGFDEAFLHWHRWSVGDWLAEATKRICDL